MVFSERLASSSPARCRGIIVPVTTETISLDFLKSPSERHLAVESSLLGGDDASCLPFTDKADVSQKFASLVPRSRLGRPGVGKSCSSLRPSVSNQDLVSKPSAQGNGEHDVPRLEPLKSSLSLPPISSQAEVTEGKNTDPVLLLESESQDSGTSTDQHKESQEVLVHPLQWSPRQIQLATLGPLRCPQLTFLELVWWAAVRVRSFFVLSLVYCSQYYIVTALVLPWVFLRREHAALVWCGYAVTYGISFLTAPEKVGSRSSPHFQKWFGSLMEEVSVLHLNGGVRIIRESKEPLDSNAQYIFGYHPHGLLPAILSWFPMTNAWKKLFGTVRPVGLVATAIFRVPILRDLNLWGGLRDVSRKTFERTLDEKKAVVICPGGQSELSVHQHSSKRMMVLDARKTGFIKAAVQARAFLVPILVFGESQLLDNPFQFPAAQKFTYKLFGFPIPFMPLGMLGFLPVPRRGSVTLVVGEPMNAGEYCSTTEPSAENLEAIRSLYYSKVQVLFQKHQEVLGYKDWILKVEARC